MVVLGAHVMHEIRALQNAFAARAPARSLLCLRRAFFRRVRLRARRRGTACAARGFMERTQQNLFTRPSRRTVTCAFGRQLQARSMLGSVPTSPTFRAHRHLAQLRQQRQSRDRRLTDRHRNAAPRIGSLLMGVFDERASSLVGKSARMSATWRRNEDAPSSRPRPAVRALDTRPSAVAQTRRRGRSRSAAMVADGTRRLDAEGRDPPASSSGCAKTSPPGR